MSNDEFIKKQEIKVDHVNTTSPDTIYTVDPNRWYSTYPYGFRFIPRNAQTANEGQTFFLPINPTDISMVTYFSTNVLPTLYGVLEEHSEVRFYDITIKGTTGFAPRHINSVKMGSGALGYKGDATKWESTGRSSQATAHIALGGFLPQLTNVISQAKNTFQELAGNGETNDTGVYTDQSGYLAFHNFYRFLMIYKKDASGELGFGTRKFHPLTWLNYKDGIKLDCSINTFNMQRSAANPFLYEYSISMRCYNLRSIDAQDVQMVTEDIGINTGGLDITNNPLFAKISNKAKSVTNAINSITGWF